MRESPDLSTLSRRTKIATDAAQTLDAALSLKRKGSSMDVVSVGFGGVTLGLAPDSWVCRELPESRWNPLSSQIVLKARTAIPESSCFSSSSTF